MTDARILYVDDEDDIREVATLALELDGHMTVRTCASGAEALEAAATWQPDLILLDVMMPRMDGPQRSLSCARTRHCRHTRGVHHRAHPSR